MAFMKLTDVPELAEFTGTEKIYVNDNGVTKQITCDKVATGGRIIINMDEDDFPSPEEIVSMIENGDDVWVVADGILSKIISFDWLGGCGPGRYLYISYIQDGEIRQNLVMTIWDIGLVERLRAITS